MLERHALEKFHHDERLAVVLSDLVNGADVRVIQCRRRAGLASESFQRLLVRGHAFGEKLESDKSAEFGIFGLVDHAHTAATEFLKDAIVGDGHVEHGNDGTWAGVARQRARSGKLVELLGRPSKTNRFP